MPRATGGGRLLATHEGASWPPQGSPLHAAEVLKRRAFSGCDYHTSGDAPRKRLEAFTRVETVKPSDQDSGIRIGARTCILVPPFRLESTTISPSIKFTRSRMLTSPRPAPLI